jgi:3-hydroxyacyl-[acyl-carrier-protein] dehydratase
MRFLPHRYPFMLLDRVVAFTPGESLTAIKNVTVNEPFFQGHFPGRPVMPGVLILEVCAQAAGLLGLLSLGEDAARDYFCLLAGVGEARFRRIVAPGDVLQVEVKLLRTVRQMQRCAAQARVGDEPVCETEIMTAVRKV